jgi:acyl-coenzyme A synthetase/AMP-(fatty) acid ligase
MKMPPLPERTLRSILRGSGDLTGRVIWGRCESVALHDLVSGTGLGGHLAALAGRSVLIATKHQLTAAIALIELDGVARRMTLCPPGVPIEHLASVAADAEADAIIRDADAPSFGDFGVPLIVTATPHIVAADEVAGRSATEWVLLTSGTTGAPKLVMHSLASLTDPIKPVGASAAPAAWATFYDIRRYGGLQIFLRAMLGTGSMILSSAEETPAEHLARLGRLGVTHISGTPSHWRRVLMSGAAHAMAPGYVRLSGEIADQAVLDNLRATYPQAGVGHAYASTEAGVGFDVNDGREGFPATYIEQGFGDVEMKVVDGSLRIKSRRLASLYVGRDGKALADSDGFVDTGDMLERRGDRYYFVGRRGGIINVGGQKVHPEEVEAVINAHRDVRMSLVSARRNPITGAIVVADVVLSEDARASGGSADTIKSEILQICRDQLAQHKVPVTIRFVPSLAMTAGGKLSRADA